MVNRGCKRITAGCSYYSGCRRLAPSYSIVIRRHAYETADLSRWPAAGEVRVPWRGCCQSCPVDLLSREADAFKPPWKHISPQSMHTQAQHREVSHKPS